ncbi:hypothetical protein quinque_002766 [Culex quinquefasciatus]
MDCTNIVIGTAREETYRVCDYYTRDRRGVHLLEDKSDLTATRGFEVDGIYSDVEVKQTELTEVEAENRTNDGKKKKEKKPKKVDSDDQDATESAEVEEVTTAVKKLTVAGKDKKGKKDKKPEADDDGENGDAADEADDGGKKSKGKKKGKAAAGPVGFSLLMADDDDDDDGGQEKDTIRDDDDGDDGGAKKGKAKGGKKQQVKDEDDEPAQKGGKKAKKGKKKKGGDSDDEDIEKMLAELELEYSGVKPAEEPAAAAAAPEADKKEPEKKKDKKDKKKKEDTPPEAADEPEPEEGGVHIKTAAEKRKEKKERQKKEAQAAKQAEKESAEVTPKESKESTPAPAVQDQPEEAAAPAAAGEGKKKKKKGKKDEAGDAAAAPEAAAEEKPAAAAAEAAKPAGDAAKDDKKKKGPNKAAIALMQERLKAIREEEERLKREEEEKERLAEEAEKYRLEQLKLEQEKKEKKKQKEKERKERLKAEGKLLTAKQKQDRMRAQAMLDALKAQGVEIPEVGVEKKVRPGTRIRPKKKDDGTKEGESKEESPSLEEQKKAEAEAAAAEAAKKAEEVKESWDASDSEEEEPEPAKPEVKEAPAPVKKQDSKKQSESDDDEDDSEDDDDESDDESEDESDSEEDNRPESEKIRQRAMERIAKRTQDAQKKLSTDNLRAAVVCVLGHVDTGKTKILDKLRRTNVQDAEAGGITQQIGATNVPIDNIKEQTKFVKGYGDTNFKLPGLLIIDTPGHESFSNLRNRGSSLCDIAILVVDIMHGLEPQTIESINLLKAKRTPFVVALNKIDRLYDWNTMNRKDVRDILKAQASNTQLEFTQRTKEVIVQFAEQGLNAALYYENPDPKTYISLVPTSAITGEGMGNLLFLIVQSCQKQLAKRLMFSEDLQATVLEVKAIPGLGTTIDAILINGKLREGDTMILAGTEGPITTQIKALLMPQPMKELRVKNAYIEHKEVVAAQGVKIAAKELEKAIAGLNLQIAQKPDEVEICRDIVARDLKSVLSSIKLSERGVYVQASTLGSLEALLEFLRTSKIPVKNGNTSDLAKRLTLEERIKMKKRELNEWHGVYNFMILSRKF